MKKFIDRYSFLAGVSTTLIVIMWIWLPEFLLWYVRPAAISTEVISASKASPETAVLDELGQMDMKPPSSIVSYNETIRQAENITRGILSVPGFPTTEISPVFSDDDLNKYPQLYIASLVAVDQLMDGYSITGREEFFNLAKQNILSFAEFESSRLLDKGMLWNDHAIGARISVFIKFWIYYRQRSDFDEAIARTLLKLVARSGLLLAKPEHYAWRTGHGIISDLVLLQISAAFPALEESSYFREIAMQRLTDHIPYYVNREGVTLLHSAGYNDGGVRFLAMAMRLYTLHDQNIPSDWWARYQKVEEFYAIMRRPDGTLPMFGDTLSIAKPYGPARTVRIEEVVAAPLNYTPEWSHHGGIGLYPAAGYAIWWHPWTKKEQGSISQTVAAWSYYPELGHKLADELSILVWAQGRSWITNTGYWPYGFIGRLQAESWGGSNAPHLHSESASSKRSSKLNKVSNDEENFFIELERIGPDGFRVQREILQLGAATWIVLDRFQDSMKRDTDTFWTFYPDLKIVSGQTPGSYRLSSPDSQQLMHVSIQASPEANLNELSGSWGDPFAGWVVIGQTPVPANTIAIKNTSNQGWQLSVFSIQNEIYDNSNKDMTATFTDEDESSDWIISIGGVDENSQTVVSRNQDYINIVTHDSNKNIILNNVLDPQSEIQSVLAAIETAAQSSVRQVPLIPYRLNMTYILLILLANARGFFLVDTTAHATFVQTNTCSEYGCMDRIGYMVNRGSFYSRSINIPKFI